MVCQQCGKETSDNGKFCSECGSRISAESRLSGNERRISNKEQMNVDVSIGDMPTIEIPWAQSDDMSIGDMETLVPKRPGAGFSPSGSLDSQVFSERYELGEEIGSGGFAKVYKATDKKLGRTVAVKKLHPEKANAITVARFRREAISIAGLNHRNVVQVYDVGEDSVDGSIYLVMELIDGGTLHELLKKKKKLSLEEALPLFEGIAQGLAYAHRKNLVHRDIKPANILLTDDTPKIVDFGLAQAGRDSELSMSGYGLGTPHYMPPEQRRDAKSVNHTADIYALGKVLYAMVTGQIPDTLDPDEIPPPKELAKIIFKCTKPKPEDRFFSVDELLREMEKIRGKKPNAGGQTIGKRQSSLGNGCPGCGAENEKGVKFCVGCGGGLFRVCPECGKENSIHEQFCGSCGTDVDGFLEAQELFDSMSRYAQSQKWRRSLKVSKDWKPKVKLVGSNGMDLRKRIEYGIAYSKEKVAIIESLTSKLTALQAEIAEEKSAYKKGADQKILQVLESLAKTQTLSDTFQALEKEATERIAAARVLAGQIRKKNILKGLIAVFLLLLVYSVLTVCLIGSFKKAFNQKEISKAETLASSLQKLGGFYDSSEELETLRWISRNQTQMDQFGGEHRGLFGTFGGTDWVEVERLTAEAQIPGSPSVAIEKLKKAQKLAMDVQFRIDEMLKAEAVFSEGWKSSVKLLKQFEPTTYAELNKRIERVNALTNPDEARDGWKKLSSELSPIQKKLNNLRAVKETHQKVVADVGSEVLKQYGRADWDAAKAAVKQAGNAGTLSAAIVALEKATASVKKAESFVKTEMKWTATFNGREVAATLNIGNQSYTLPATVKLKKDQSYSSSVFYSGCKVIYTKVEANWYGLEEKSIELEEWMLPDNLVEVSGATTANSEQKAAVAKTSLPLEVRSKKTEISFRLVPAGTFMMGSHESEGDRDSDEGPQHSVKISKPFYCGKFEVTQAQWKQVMGTSPSSFQGSENPVENVSWNDCQTFLKKLCDLEGVQQGTYRLFTEAQWEYACRAGTTGKYAGRLGSMAWYDSNGGDKTHPVGTKKANAWGLYDMHGNVWEWCCDWYGDYSSGSVTDPTDVTVGSSRVYRGGSWYSDARRCRSANRNGYTPGYRRNYVGFRLLRTAPNLP